MKANKSGLVGNHKVNYRKTQTINPRLRAKSPLAHAQGLVPLALPKLGLYTQCLSPKRRRILRSPSLGQAPDCLAVTKAKLVVLLSLVS